MDLPAQTWTIAPDALPPRKANLRTVETAGRAIGRDAVTAGCLIELRGPLTDAVVRPEAKAHRAPIAPSAAPGG